LIQIAQKFKTLEEFYTQLSLHSGETSSEDKKDGVKILTIHTSKGLEFRQVFLPFWVAGVMPMTGSGWGGG
jgi:DNA helicase-2/ATP-dependent DNA helicase PcrA